MSDDPRLIGLLTRWRQLRGEGKEATVEDLCRECPELADELATELAASGFSPVGPSSETGETRVMAPDLAASLDRTERLYEALGPPLGPEEIGRLGSYRVVKLLGAGGMGEVFQAVDEQLGRSVALKTLRPALAHDPVARRRFLREARAAAALEHDHVVTIYQVGEERGVPFLAMPLLHGIPLDDWLKGQDRVPVAETARIGREMAEGLAAAHAVGLVHRDIKPANVWLEGPRRRVKILDFGLVRAVEESDAQLTGIGVIMGTPAYMAPEQAAGEEVDHRCDLFSLGVVLYRMLAGALPWTGRDSLSILRSMALDDPRTPRDLNPEVPPPLSDLVMRLLARDRDARPASAHAVADELARLEVALATPPAAAAVAAPPGRRRWIGPLVAAAMLGGALIAWQVIIRIRDKEGRETVIKAPAGSTVTVETAEAPGPEARTSRPAPPAPTPRKVATAPAAAASPLGPLDRLDPAAIPPVEKFPWQPDELVAVFGTHRMRHWGPVRCLALTSDGKTIATGGDQNGTILLWDVATMRVKDEVKVGWRHKGPTALTFAPDGKTLAAAYADALHLWDVGPAGLTKRQTLASSEDRVYALAFAPDGRTLAAHGATAVRLWDTSGTAPKPGATLAASASQDGYGGSQSTLAFAPDSKTLAVASDPDRRIRLFRLTGAAEAQEGTPLDVEASPVTVAISPDGKALAASLRDGTLRLWDLDGTTATPRSKGQVSSQNAWTRSLNFALGGKLLVIGGAPDAEIWGVDGPRLELKGKVRASHYLSAGYVRGAVAATSADGRLMVTGGPDGSVRVWDLRERILPVPRAPGSLDDYTPGLAFSPVGGTLATTSADGNNAPVARLWACDGPAPREQATFTGSWIADPEDSQPLAFSRDGKALAVPESNAGVRVHPLNGRAPGASAFVGVENFHGFALSPDGATVATGDHSGKTQLWRVDGESPRLVADLGSNGHSPALVFSPDGTMMAQGGYSMAFWDLTPGDPRVRLRREVPGLSYTGFAFAPDGRSLVLDMIYNQYVLDLTEPTSEPLLLKSESFKPESWAMSASFAPDGKTFATGGDWITLWDAGSRTPLREWKLPGRVYRVAFAPDGRHLVTANANGTLYVLRLATSGSARDALLAEREDGSPRRAITPRPHHAGSMFNLDPARITAAQRTPGQPRELVAVIGDNRMRHLGEVMCVAISPDGATVASGEDNGSLFLWDARTMRRSAVVKTPGHVRALAFHPTGKTLAYGTQGRVGLLDLQGETPTMTATLSDTSAWTRSLVYSPDGLSLAYQDAHSVQLWDVSAPRPRLRAAFEGGDTRPELLGGTVAFAPDGKTLAACMGPEKVVRVWDLSSATPEEKWVIPTTDPPLGLAFTPDGKSLVTACGKFRVWDLSGPSPRQTNEANFGDRGMLTFLPDGKTLVVGEGGPIGFFATRGGEITPVVNLDPSENDVGGHGVALSRDGRTMATGGRDGTLKVWDLHPGRLPESRFFGRPFYKSEPSFSPDGTSLAIARGDGFVEVWDVVGTAPSLRGALGPFAATHSAKVDLAFAPSGATLAVTDGKSLRLWDVGDGAPKPGPVVPGHDVLRNPVFGAGGQTIAAVELPDLVRLWDLSGDSPRPLESLKGLNPTWSLSYGRDGRWLVESNHETCALWRAEPGKAGIWTPLARKPEISGDSALSPDGKTLVSVRDNTVVVFDMSGPEPVEKARGTISKGITGRPTFSPDGASFAVAGNAVVVFDTAALKPVYEWTATGASDFVVQYVAFAPDGHHLAAVLANGTINILRLP